MWSRQLVSASLRLGRRQFHSLLNDLTQRGFIHDITRRDALENALRTRPQTVYAGVDPTAKALHIGHLVPLMCLLHFQVRGHRIIPLIGGATGRVGDPSDRLTERHPADIRQVEENVVSLTSSMQKFFQRALYFVQSRTNFHDGVYSNPAVLSNLDWHGSFMLLDFLQKVGIHGRVNAMINRDSVRTRLDSHQGLSFTEFTYQLLQAYDFFHLNKHHGCTIQVGGSDQWGNIVAGLELIGKLNNPLSSPTSAPSDAFGITTPLLTTSTGEKFGKSAGNAIWLDPELTSVFDFYQYFIKMTDADVGKYLRLFTFLPIGEIESILSDHARNPELRIAQHCLASEITEMVHEKTGVVRAATMTNLVFGSDYSKLKAKDILSSFENDARLITLAMQELFETPIIKLTARYGLVSSNSAARNLVSSRGLYLNNQVIQDVQYKLSEADLLDNQIVVLRAGKDNLLVLAGSGQ